MARAWGWARNGESVFDGDRASIGEDEKALEVDGGDSSTSCIVTELTLKMVKMVDFACVFYSNKK